MTRTLMLSAAAVVTLSCSRSDDSAARISDSAATTPAVAATRAGDSAVAAPGRPPISGDTIRGTIAVISNEPSAEVTLTVGDTVVVLRGTDLTTLRRATGLDVVVRGRRTSERTFTASPRGSAVFEVTSFSVRSAQGEPAVDGVLDIQQGVFFLTTPEGTRVDVPSLPVPLRGEIGSRIYLVGSLSSGVTAFGVLADRQ
jgi:hypothetical protein